MKRPFDYTCLLLLIFAFTIWGCENYYEESSAQNATEEVNNQTIISLENAVYHEATNSWISPSGDPYDLKNFQKAYDNILKGNSDQTLNKNVAVELSKIQLKATHFNVKIYPKTEKELREIELMEDITFSYIPFNYVQLPENLTDKIKLTKANVLFSEEPRYVEQYDDYMTEEGGSEASKTIYLPIIYAVWPCNKAFPSDMDYEILYEVFLPEDNGGIKTHTLSDSILDILEMEAINLIDDGPYITKNSVLGTSAQGKVLTYCNVT